MTRPTYNVFEAIGQTKPAVVAAAMRIGYADPPYIGCAHLYKDHPDYAGEVDHVELLRKLDEEFDGWILHMSTPSVFTIAHICAEYGYGLDARWMAWVKPFAAFKRNVPVAYAWEPCLVKPARKPVVDDSMTYRDWIAEGITMKRGLTGAKPEAVCHWAFNVMGADPADEFFDLYPGTGAVTNAWHTWCDARPLPIGTTNQQGAKR